MSRRAGVIDSGYRGEWFVPINNTSNKVIVIARKRYVEANPFLNDCEHVVVHPYEKAIVQIAMEEVPVFETKEVTYEELMSITSVRGTGSRGSSGK